MPRTPAPQSVAEMRKRMRARRSHIVKFMEKVEVIPSGCWPWRGHIQPNGYGYYRHDRTKWAHRASHLMFIGPIPEGYEVDHLCRNPICVNPDHLEAVTPTENMRRAAKAWTTCEEFHPGQPPRWAIRNDGRKFCRECNAQRERRRRAQAAAKRTTK